MKRNGRSGAHVLALAVVAIWGTTFVSTKVLIGNGLTPAWIFFIRFAMAYVGILLISAVRKSFRSLLADSLKDEMVLAFLGLTGGSLYFLTENSALGLTQATNVSFIVTVTPVLTALVAVFMNWILKTKQSLFTKQFVFGSAVALAGIFLLVFDGDRPVISPKGDLLALGAAFCWALYSNLILLLRGDYGSLFVTRKVFFYGLLTVIPMLERPFPVGIDVFATAQVWGNLLFLGVVASLFCFVAWNRVLKVLGSVIPTNYLYLNPFCTMLTAVVILGEKVTVLSAVGSVAIVVGVAVSQYSRK